MFRKLLDWISTIRNFISDLNAVWGVGHVLFWLLFWIAVHFGFIDLKWQESIHTIFGMSAQAEVQPPTPLQYKPLLTITFAL